MTDQPADPEQQTPHQPWRWGWAAVLAAVTLATLAFRYDLPIRDGDIWWHMLYGRYFLENRILIADHTISLSADNIRRGDHWLVSGCRGTPPIFICLHCKLQV